MKIAQIVCAYPPYNGGIGQSAQRLGNVLIEDHELLTFTLKPQQVAVNSTDKVKYLQPFFRFGHGGLPFSLLFSLKKYDCLYLHYPFFGAAEIIWFYLLFTKKKLIIHYHMDTPALPFPLNILSWPSKVIRTSLFKKADRVICSSLDYLTNSQIKNLVQKWPEKFTELAFGVDINLFLPKVPIVTHGLMAKAQDIVNFVTNKFIKRGRVSLLFVGGLDPAHYFKGLPVLFDALSIIPETNWQLSIVGTGSLQKSYQEKVDVLGFTNMVKFLGRLNEAELIKSYQDADIFILPSINSHEAFGLVLIEAMACGTPVIASNLPGVKTVFRNEIDGLLSEPNDAQSLSQKLSILISDEKKRLNMGHNARAYVIQKYNQDLIAKKLKQLFYENSSS